MILLRAQWVSCAYPLRVLLSCLRPRTLSKPCPQRAVRLVCKCFQAAYKQILLCVVEVNGVSSVRIVLGRVFILTLLWLTALHLLLPTFLSRIDVQNTIRSVCPCLA